MSLRPRRSIEDVLRERLEMAGCYFLRGGARPGEEVWFTPHLNREFALPRPINNVHEANAVLFRAGLEQVFRESHSEG